MAENVKTNVNKPFDWLMKDDWVWLADYSDSQEYTYLDDIYRTIEGSISEEEFYDYGHGKIEDFKAEYQKRFPLMLADFLETMAEEIRSGKLLLNIQFEDTNVPD